MQVNNLSLLSFYMSEFEYLISPNFRANLVPSKFISQLRVVLKSVTLVLGACDDLLDNDIIALTSGKIPSPLEWNFREALLADRQVTRCMAGL